MFGLDGEGPDSLERTVDLCIESDRTMALFAILTPYRGTRLYARLSGEGRLVLPRWWLDEDSEARAPLFDPLGMSRQDLRDVWVRSWERMYTFRSIAHRYDPGVGHGWVRNVAHWPLNLTMRELARRKIAGGEGKWRSTRRIDVPLRF